MKDKDVIITHPYQGMGDNILYRPFIKKLAKEYRSVLLQTSWPQLYKDISGVKLISPHNRKGLAWEKDLNLFSQRRNWERFSDDTWDNVTDEEIENAEKIILNYQDSHIQMISFRAALCRTVQLNEDEFEFNIPIKSEWLREAKEILSEYGLDKKKPVVLMHKPIIRAEWSVPARNPKPEYYQAIIDRYGDAVQFIDVVDIEKGKQWFDGNIEGVTEIDGRGICTEVLWAITSLADAVVSGNCFYMHLAPAVNTPLLAVFGGWVRPECLFDKYYNIEHLRIVAPEPFCHCVPSRTCTKCNKELDTKELFAKFEEIIQCKKH